MLKIKSIKPLFNKIITTSNLYTEDLKQNGLIVKTSGNIKEYQTVEAVGSMVKDIKVGDIVMINPTRYTVPKHNDKSLKNGVIGDEIMLNVNFPTVEYGGKNHLLLYDSDVDYIIEGEEESTLVLPEEKKIIV